MVKLKRPQPDISFHGIARKGIHSAPRFTFHDRQMRWLEENVFQENRALARPSSAWDSMKAFFSGKMRADTMTPMWLEKDQIAKWLAGKKAEEKTRRRENAKKQKSEEKACAELPQPAPTQTKAQIQTKAPAKAGKGKAKASAKAGKSKANASASTKDTGSKVSRNVLSVLQLPCSSPNPVSASRPPFAAFSQTKSSVQKGTRKGKRTASLSTSSKVSRGEELGVLLLSF